jgi:hypothetical protein
VNLTRWFALGLVLAPGILLSGYVLLRADVAVARHGYLPGVCGGSIETVFAGASGAELDIPIRNVIPGAPGEVVLLGVHSWMVAVAGHILGPFGRAQRGAPGYLGDPQDVVVTDTAVYILDVAAHAVRVFSRTGSFVRSVPLRQTGASWWQPRQLFVVDNEFYVSALETGSSPAAWSVLRWPAGQTYPAREFSIPGTSVNGILVEYTRAGAWVGEMADYRIQVSGVSGRIERTMTRRDPPLHPFSREDRKRYRSYWSRLPPALREVYAMPDYLPPLSAFKQLPDGRFAAALTHNADSVHVELLDRNATPLCRVTERPINRVAGLSERGIYWIEEDDEELVLKHASYGHANRD